MNFGSRKWFSVALLYAVIVAPSASAKVAGTSLDISLEGYDNSGNPVLVANSKPIGGQPIKWQRCHPDPGNCVDLAGNLPHIHPGESEPGTVFKASVVGNPSAESLTSNVWHGTLRATTPPTLNGTPKVGEVVTPIPGSWTGGWSAGYDSLTAWACKSPKSPLCEVVSASTSSGRTQRDRPIGRSHVGWLLFAVSTRFTGDEVFPMIGFGPIRPNPLLALGANRSASVAYGPVKTSDTYGASIFRRAKFSSRSVALAKLRCRSGCDFRATVRLRRNSGLREGKRTVRTVVLKLPANGHLILRRSIIRGSTSALVAITDRGVPVARKTVQLKVS